jgi:two-component system response regulator FlrC
VRPTHRPDPSAEDGGALRWYQREAVDAGLARENVVLRAVVLCTGEVITPAHLMFDEPAELQVPSAPEMMPAEVAAALSQPTPPSTYSDGGMAARPAAFEPQPAPWQPSAASPQAAEAVTEPASLQQAVQINEHQLILSAIQSTLSRMDAARKLGISPRTLRYKIARLRESGLALAA